MSDVKQVTQELEESAFLADVGPEDRKIGRLLLTIALGLGAVVAAVVVMVILGSIVTAFYLVSTGRDPAELTAIVTAFQDPEHQLTYQETMIALIFVGFANSVIFIGPVFIAALLARKHIRSYITAAPRFRWRLMLAGVGLFVLVLGPVLAVGAWLDPEMPTYPMLRLTETTGQMAIYAVVGVLCLFPAAFARRSCSGAGCSSRSPPSRATSGCCSPSTGRCSR